jgi:hypothetical protein
VRAHIVEDRRERLGKAVLDAVALSGGLRRKVLRPLAERGDLRRQCGLPEFGLRSTERELQIKAQMASELPIEPELERWFPLWGIPI